MGEDLEYGGLRSRGHVIVYTGGFVLCPECGGEAEVQILPNSGFSATFECLDESCGVKEQIR